MNHVTVQAFRHGPAFRGRPHHVLVHQAQLVHAADHHVGLYALAVTADEIVVERRVQVLDRLHPREWLVSVDEIHVEGVLGQPHAGCAHHRGAEGQRMHENVFRQSEMAQIVPGQSFVGLHGATEVHHVFHDLADLVVHVVGHQHVDRIGALGLLA